jgi:YbgC/YbaW family acyl-CoA thioester hydrolase
MGRSHRTAVKVRWGEADPMGIVFYPTYFAWFDHATHELFASSGRSLMARVREDGTSVPIAECGARFRAPVFADDELDVVSTAAEIGSRFFRIEHVVERGGGQVATGFEVRVVARVADGGRLEVLPVPDDLRAWLGGGSE